MVEKTLSEVKHEDGKGNLKQKVKMHKKIPPLVTQFQPSLPNLKSIVKLWTDGI